MANPEHLAIPKQGVEVWNRWLRNNRRSADLTNASLLALQLVGVDFVEVNLEGTQLDRADLFGSDLYRANLSSASLFQANLSQASLHRAILTGADLSHANLSHASLNKAILNNVILGDTILANCDLRQAVGLDHCKHEAPSIIDHRTLTKPGILPEAFLRGVGLPDKLIDFIPSLLAATESFSSVFMSYSTADQDFAQKLHTDLQQSGVRCWFAPHDIQGGKKLHEQIDDAIRVYDRLLLILSDASMNSEWVKTEIANARQQEIQEHRLRLSRGVRQPVRHWLPFDDRSFCRMRQYVYSGLAGEAETGTAGEQPDQGIAGRNSSRRWARA